MFSKKGKLKMPFDSQYLKMLRKNPQKFQEALNQTLLKYQVTGDGYMDLIVSCNLVFNFLEELSQMPIAAIGINWFCLYIPDSPLALGCPHGGGGPLNKFGNGQFCECYQYQEFDVSEYGVNLEDPYIVPSDLANNCNNLISNYLRKTYPHEEKYSSCLHPGLFLYVPPEWGL